MKLLVTLLLTIASTSAQLVELRPDILDLLNATAQPVTHKGAFGLRLTEAKKADSATAANAFGIAMLRGVTMQNGEIELEVAGEPGPTASPDARGFVGIAFRVKDERHMEVIYLRPTNGRADDQVRRNHTVQYEYFPDFPWERLRREFPKKYETYVDLESGAWTRIRIVIDGLKARLYVHGAAQPTLIVNDMKGPTEAGGIGLWIGPGTVGHFRGLKITKK